LAYIYMRLAVCKLQLQDYEGAVALTKKAEPVFDTDRIHIAGVLNAIGHHYEQEGKFEQAFALKTKSLELCERSISRVAEPTVSTIVQLGGCCSLKGDHEGARNMYKEALERLYKRKHDQFSAELIPKMKRCIIEEEQRMQAAAQ
ncbi:MAG: tetratricopeptide repeat protein, partial [Cyanobacteria bacterium]|nr:tetratricopeptide repeat protein [Cyanobacteriota bacterium]